jgi:glycosyltransferase involved in cell wall biosynthesis
MTGADQRAPVRVVILSYWVTEESGGPGVAAAGFAEGLARLGAEVTLVAFEGPKGTWLVDERSAAERGFALRRVPAGSFVARTRRMLSVVSEILAGSPAPTVIWANAIWNAQSLAAGIAGIRWGIPYVIRPAGSLGHAALGRKRLKKWVYLNAVEAHVIRRASGVHCMTTREVDELPLPMRARAFVVPSGVELPSARVATQDPSLVGVLARIHPIKNTDRALDAIEELVRSGRDLHVELAGSTSDAAYEAFLRQRVGSSTVLASRVRFLGHVGRDRLPDVVGRWRAALLLSDQENFGHAVVTAAALGVPSVVSPGVGLGPDLEARGAGIVAAPGGVPQALACLLDSDPDVLANRCTQFASSYGWDSCSRALLDHLDSIARRGVVSPPP